MQTIQALTWQASANNLGPVSNVVIDFTLDLEWQFTHLAGNYGTVDVTPKFLTIENLNGDQRIDVVFDDSITYPVNPFQRLTVPVPPGGRRCSLTSIGTTPAAIVATFAVDDLSAADNFNFKGISAVASNAVLRPMDFIPSVVPIITSTDLGRVKVFQNTVNLNLALPLSTTLENGFWFSVWVDEAFATRIVTVACSGADIVVGENLGAVTSTSIIAQPGSKYNFYTNGNGIWYAERTNPYYWLSAYTGLTVSTTFNFVFNATPPYYNAGSVGDPWPFATTSLEFKCVIAQYGYNVNQNGIVLTGVDAATASSGYVISNPGPATFQVDFGSSVQIIRNDTKASAALTPANWQFRLRVELL